MKRRLRGCCYYYSLVRQSVADGEELLGREAVLGDIARPAADQIIGHAARREQACSVKQMPHWLESPRGRALFMKALPTTVWATASDGSSVTMATSTDWLMQQSSSSSSKSRLQPLRLPWQNTALMKKVARVAAQHLPWRLE